MKKNFKFFLLLLLCSLSSLYANNDNPMEHIEVNLPEEQWTRADWCLPNEDCLYFFEWWVNTTFVESEVLMVIENQSWYLDDSYDEDLNDEEIAAIISEMVGYGIEEIYDVDRIFIYQSSERDKITILSRTNTEIFYKFIAEEDEILALGRCILTDKFIHHLSFTGCGKNFVDQVDQEKWVTFLKQAPIVNNDKRS